MKKSRPHIGAWHHARIDADRRAAIARRGRRLEYFTISWNTLEGLIAVAAGAAAGSVSLVAFGIDSFIEVTSGATLLWRMALDADHERLEHIEARSLRIVGACFLALAVYVACEALIDLAGGRAPAHSLPGIVLACASLVVMPLLSRAKRRVGQSLGSRAMEADATQTDFCVYFSAILLGGLALNMWMGWWWADPVAALAMSPMIGREGLRTVRGDACGGTGPAR